MVIETLERYSLDKIHDEFLCLNYTGDKLDHEGNKIAITLQVFDNVPLALETFEKVKALSDNGKKSVHFGSFIRSIKDYHEFL